MSRGQGRQLSDEHLKGDQLLSIYFVNQLHIIVIQTGVLPVLRKRWVIYQGPCLVNSIRVVLGSK
jgi:hypothetical protein